MFGMDDQNSAFKLGAGPETPMSQAINWAMQFAGVPQAAQGAAAANLASQGNWQSALPLGASAALALAPMALGIRAYHGSPADFTAFDPALSNTGFYGKGTYFHLNPEDAARHKFTATAPEGGKTYEANLNTQRPFDMQGPVSAEDAANALEALGQTDRAARVRQNGQGFRSGSEFWYWGMGQDTPADARAAALQKAGFDAITGANPSREMTGTPQRSDIVNVLDPSIIEILRKYGIAGPVVGAGGASMFGGGDQ